MNNIEYRQIPGFPDYDAGSDGSIWSKKRGKYTKRKPIINDRGYYIISLSMNNRKTTHTIHRLIAITFLGPRPKNMEVCHGLNGKLDNSVTNLKYGTHQENCIDRARDGTDTRGEKSVLSKVNDKQVLEIRAIAQYMTYIEMSKIYNISFNTIKDIITRRTWKHLPITN